MADTTGIDWQRQSFKKGGTEPAPSQTNPKLQGGSSQMHSKIAKPTHPAGGLVSGANDVLHMANGGLVAGLAAGLGAAYLMSKNKDKPEPLPSGENLGSGESTAKPKIMEIAPKESVAETSRGENNPIEKRVTDEPQKSKMYEATPGEGVAKAAEPVKAAPKKTAARPVASKPVNVSSGASGFGKTERDEAPSKPSPFKSGDNESRPSKSYPDVVDRSIRAEAKSGVKTVYNDQPFSFQKKNEEARAAAAKEAADREAKARTRKVGSDIRYNEAGDAY